MIVVRFELTKHNAYDLESHPFDQTRVYYQIITSCGIRTHNPQIRSLMRYPIAPMRHQRNMLEEGFEPSKRVARDLKSLPFDQTREP